MVIWFQKTGMQILLWLLGIVDSIFGVFKVTAGLTPAKQKRRHANQCASP